MAATDVTSSILGPGVLEFGDDPDTIDFSMQMTNVALIPSHEESDQTGTLGKPKRAADVKTTWVLGGTQVQDFELEATEGFSEYARVNNNQEKFWRFVPNDAYAIQYSGKAQIRAVQIGGEIDTELTADFSLPITEGPDRATVPAP